MKKYFVAVMAVCALAAQIAVSQVYVREVQITNGARFATTAGTASGITYVTSDSTVDINLIYTNENHGIVNQYPDSAKLVWYGKGTTTADSVGLMLSVKAKKDQNSAYVARTLLDSIKAQENDSKLITRTVYEGLNRLGVAIQLNSIAGGPNKTEHISLGGATFRCSLLLFYRRPD
jgi:hypothetical protein